MTLTISELESVVPEILQAIRGAAFAGVESPDVFTCVLTFAPVDGGAPRRVLFSRRPRLTRLNLVPAGAGPIPSRGPGSAEAARFVQDARTLLQGLVAGAMRPRFNDRVVSLEMVEPPRRGEERPGRKMTVLFECTGMHPNMFVLDDRQVIQAMFGRSTSTRRSLDVGCRYEQPAASDAVKSTGRRVDVIRFVASGSGINEQVASMYDGLDAQDAARRELAGLGERLSAVVQSRRRVADSVLKDLALPVRPGRPDDLHDRLRARLERIQAEIDELQTLLSGVRGGRTDVLARAKELVLEFEAQQAERQEKWSRRGGSERPARGDAPRGPRPPRQDGGYGRRDDAPARGDAPRGPRPPRQEGGYGRRDDAPARGDAPRGRSPRTTGRQGAPRQAPRRQNPRG